MIPGTVQVDGIYYPVEFRTLAKAIDVKWFRVSDIQAILPSDCKNCGGVGWLGIFVSKRGPFKSPGHPYGEETSKWDQETYAGQGGWWVGKTFTLPCPVCLGSGSSEKKGTPGVKPQAVQATYELTEKFNAR